MTDYKDLIIQNLTTENGALAEALGQSTEARGRQADRIAALENENADLRRQVEALQGARRVLVTLAESSALPLTLTDRDPWGDGCAYHDGYDAGDVTVMQLRGAG